jgi:tryptophan 2,3-dioxygenase
VGRRFGEEGRRLSYGTYLKVVEVLSLQQALSKEHDELLFVVAHQVYELWFKLVLFELEAARDRIDADDIFFARHYLRRVHVVERLLIEQIEVLETMSPQDFLAFRSQLAPASGFQSVQFREIEFLSGLKEPKYLARVEATPEEAARLRRGLDEPSLDDAFRAWSSGADRQAWSRCSGIANATVTSSTFAKRCSTTTRRLRIGGPATC